MPLLVGQKRIANMKYWRTVAAFEVLLLLFLVDFIDGTVVLHVDSCYKAGTDMTITAEYTGSDTFSTMEWFYSEPTSGNIVIIASSCAVFGSVGTGFPTPVSRISFQCPSTGLPQHNYTLTVRNVTEAELTNKKWGAKFTLDNSPEEQDEKNTTMCPSPAPTPGPIPDKCDCWWAHDCDEDSWQCILCEIIRAFIICLLIVVGLILVGMVVAVILLAISESLNSSTSSDCCDCCDEEFVRCNKCKCCPCCNVDNLPHWYQILCCSIIGSPTAFGIYIIWRLKQINGDVEPGVDNSRHETKRGNQRTGQKKPVAKKNKSKDSAAQIENEQHNQGKTRREQPPPPHGAGAATGTTLNGREDSDGEVSREHVDLQVSGHTLPQSSRPIPDIPRGNGQQGDNDKGRHSSATISGEKHPLTNIVTPSQKAGILESLPEGKREEQVKKLKKKKLQEDEM